CGGATLAVAPPHWPFRRSLAVSLLIEVPPRVAVFDPAGTTEDPLVKMRSNTSAMTMGRQASQAIVSSGGQDARSIRHPALAIHTALAAMRAAASGWPAPKSKKLYGPNTTANRTIPTAKPMPASFGREP